jgi:hypothetical protein
MENKNLKEKLLNDKEQIRKSIKENSPFKTDRFMHILADLIDYSLGNNTLENNFDNAMKSLDSEDIKKLMQLEEDKKNSRMISPTETPEHFNLKKIQLENFVNDLITKYTGEKEAFMDSLANLTEDFIDDLKKIKEFK